MQRCGSLIIRPIERELRHGNTQWIGIGVATLPDGRRESLGLLYFGFMSWLIGAHALSPEGLPSLWGEPVGHQLNALALFLVAVGGVVGWKWELGAAVMIVSGNALWLFLNHQLLWPFGLTIFVGLAYGFSWWCIRRSLTSQRRAKT
jgi:hypothetical protein